MGKYTMEVGRLTRESATVVVEAANREEAAALAKAAAQNDDSLKWTPDYDWGVQVTEAYVLTEPEDDENEDG